MAELRSENMIELVAIDLGVIITYGSCLEFAEQSYQKSLIFPCQNRKFIKWLKTKSLQFDRTVLREKFICQCQNRKSIHTTIWITAKPYILQKILLQWICCICLAWSKKSASNLRKRMRSFFSFFIPKAFVWSDFNKDLKQFEQPRFHDIYWRSQYSIFVAAASHFKELKP